ncbi:MAG: hypothetical protein ACJASL_004064 [Paraglaciecola sp.]|jgi:hypothetical protein
MAWLFWIKYSNGILAICPKNKPLLAETLKAEKQWPSH